MIAGLAKAHIGDSSKMFGKYPCAGLLVVVGMEAGILNAEDMERHQKAESIAEVMHALRPHLNRVIIKDAQVGDICAGGLDGQPTMAGIISEVKPRRIIHVTKEVVEEEFPEYLNFTIAGIYRFNGLR